MKNIFSKIARTVIFAGPFFYLLCDNLTARNFSLSGVLSVVFLIAFLGLIWIPPCSGTRKTGTVLLKAVCYFVWFCVNLLALVNFDTRCTACVPITPLISDNGVVLNLNKGHIVSLYNQDAWQSCGCRSVISFEHDPNYVIEQIVAMRTYWTKLPDCSAVLQNYAPYLHEIDFEIAGTCFIHESADRLIVYNPRIKRLFYHYNAP